MTPKEREQIIADIFYEAAARSGLDRHAYLDEACRGLPDGIRTEVEKLLEADDRANDEPGGFLDRGPLNIGDVLVLASADTKVLEGQTAGRVDSTVDQQPDDVDRRPTSVAERYELQAELGRGGMGVVYRARDRRLGRVVALKFLSADATGYEEARQRFTREAKAAAALNHVNICTIYDIGQANGRPFIAMEYVDGRTLKQIVAREPLPVPEAIDYAVQLVEGLKSAHDAGILHRDIKPANVMATGQGQIKILDFGLAQLADPSHLSRAGTAFGTVAYMSPEQIRDETIDHRSDQWSVGVVLYQLLTGRLPFVGEHVASVIHAILHEKPKPINALRTSVAVALEQVIHKTLEKNPNGRYECTSDLLSALYAITANSQRLGTQTGLRLTPGMPSSGSKRARQELVASVDADQRAAETTLERRQVTVLFCDLANTPAGVQLDPEVLLELLPPYQSECEKILHGFDGCTVPYSGHGILVYFGFPHSHEDDAQRAVRAGLGLIEAVKRLRGDRQRVALEASIGIHTGTIITEARARGDESGSVKLVGRVSDVATQLQPYAEPNSIVISETTYERVKAQFQCREIATKLPANPLRLYQVHCQRTAQSGIDAPTIHLAPLVGRDHELNTLVERWDHAREKMGQVVLLSGEAGIGKSRLARALKEHIVQNQESWIMECRCSSLYRNRAFDPIIEWLERGLLEIQADDSSREKLERLKDHLDQNGLSVEDTLPLLAQLLSLPPDASYARSDLSPDQQKEKTQQAILSLLVARATRRPVLLIMEDLQWADPSTLDLLTLIVDQVAAARILVVLTFRPEFQPPWPVRSNLAHLCLGRLPRGQVGTLIEHITQGKALPALLREQLVAKTDGVPLFVEELTKMVLELDVMREREDCYELAGPLPSLAVPATLQDSLMARLDRLETAKPVAQLASTLGHAFTYELIKTVSKLDEESIQHQLGQLVQAELLHQRGFPPEATYVFKHALIQQTAYQSVLESQRRQYHGRIAAVLEKKFPGTARTQPELLAHHFLRSGHEQRAVRFLHAAGDKARALYANREAEQSYQEAVRILKLHGRTKLAAETLMKLALVYTAAFESDKAQAAYDEAFQLWKPLRRKRQPKSPDAGAVVLRYAVGEPISLDPGKTYDADSAFLQAQLFEGLVTVDRDQNVLPAVASRWVVSEGGTKYVFYLRENPRWSDGTPARAADFEYAWKRNLSPETDSPAAHLLDCIQNARAFRQGEMNGSDRVGVKALDGHILEVRLERPTAYLLHLLAHPIAYPLPARVIQTHQGAWTRPENIVTNGAYRLTAWKRGERLALNSSDHYDGSFPGNTHQVDCRVFTRHQRGLMAYETNELDIAEMAAADSGVMARATTAYNKELLFSPLLSTNYLVFPTNRPPLDDVRVRRAFAHVVDREALTRAVSCGEFCPATGGFVPSGMPAHSARMGLGYDPSRGRRLLAEAGYMDGRGFPSVTLLHTHGLSADGFIPLLLDAWRENLGVTVDVTMVQWDEFQARLESGLRHLMLACWVADYPDPDNFLRVVFHSTHGLNEPGWHSDRFNTLVEEASQMTDPLRRIELYREADRILVADEVAVLPLSYGQIPILVKPWVKRFPLVPSYLRQLKEIVVDQGKYRAASPDPISPPSLSLWNR